MRNIIQYPVTQDEVISTLHELAESLSYENTGIVGDMRPYILNLVIEKIKTENIDWSTV